jgi:glycosyltransferase involved in cell wall biosynthesis
MTIKIQRQKILLFSSNGSGHNLYYINIIVKELVKLEHIVSISIPKIYVDSDPYNNYILEFEGIITILTHAGINRGENLVVQSWQECLYINRAVNEVKSDLILVPTGTQASFLWPIFRLFKKRIPYKFLMLSTGQNHSNGGLKVKVENVIRNILLSLNYKSSLLTIDNVSLALLRKHKKLSAKCFDLIPDPMNNFCRPEKKVVRDNYHIAEEDYIVAICGSLDSHPRKNTKLLIDAICAIPPKEQIKLVMAGRLSNELTQYIDVLPTELSIRFILINRYLTDKELVNITTTADLICTPYLEHYSPSGIVLRAIKCRTPVLVPNYHWFKFMVETFQVGWLIPELSTESLAQSIQNARTNRVNSLSNDNLEFLERYYSVENFVAHWLSNNDNVKDYSFRQLLTDFTKK